MNVSQDILEILIHEDASNVIYFSESHSLNGLLKNVLLCLVPEPIEDDSCKIDSECPSKLACFQGICKNPCFEIQPCVANAECKVYDTEPKRTMTCSCKEGYTGKGDVLCTPITQPIEHGCTSDEQCAPTQACIDRKCVNPCHVRNPCAKFATCITVDHDPTCRCPPGMTGDGYHKCSPSKSFPKLLFTKIDFILILS